MSARLVRTPAFPIVTHPITSLCTSLSHPFQDSLFFCSHTLGSFSLTPPGPAPLFCPGQVQGHLSLLLPHLCHHMIDTGRGDQFCCFQHPQVCRNFVQLSLDFSVIILMPTLYYAHIILPPPLCLDFQSSAWCFAWLWISVSSLISYQMKAL